MADNPTMDAQHLATHICGVLRDAGYQALLVGGCVRDLVQGRAAKDFDVATDARPERIEELFPGSVGVGAAFGVILEVDSETGAKVEVATFRTDLAYSDGRRPDAVVFSGSAEEDVRRRDFTINGLLLDPAKLSFLEGAGLSLKGTGFSP